MRRVLLAGFASLLMVATLGCMATPLPGSPVDIGEPVSEVYREFPRATIFAVSCDRVTYFPQDIPFGECLTRTDYVVIFRRGDVQYAYTVSDRVVVNV
jgi:hypothetical protein